ncbi:hypothetical protein PAXRUDRAFT_825089 [Paxillus rubicundulus Ve08.2h10]|uniref:Uncharacterized protein n=1 Tax=Paxillus rubicundulus Ve08.2h10 TaxID=930991 RepID=A0A0D0E6V3_9AGAM|nr:hypothetical protein PAXRUDRAFT_825089 [Paxillus rubicundulus Ve08.2h10]
MPNLTIINDLKEPIHVAFYIGAPTHWKNNLQPNERWTADLPSIPLYFQVRWAERTDHDSGAVYRSREFNALDSWGTAGTIGAACVAGTASVVTAIACTAVGMGAAGGALATPMMMAASAGERSWVHSCIIHDDQITLMMRCAVYLPDQAAQDMLR